jgi:hypothetical protein
MSGANFAAPGCSIEIYPFENPPYALSPGMIRSVTVRKQLGGDGIGTFDIQLAPGGSNGPEDPITWSQVITPMSHVLIGMSRGREAAVVMDGVVTAAGETAVFRTSPQGNSTAGRGQGISGADFGYFFRNFNYYALTFYGLTAGTPVGGALNFVPGSLAAKLSDGKIGGTSSANSNPRIVGQAWYNEIMAGQNGLLGKTFLPYIQGNQVLFNDALATVWEDYPGVFIPMADFFMVGDESWADKFHGIFPSPWYEFFVTTAPAGAYALASGSGDTTPGRQFQMTSVPNAAPGGPQLVARVNPVPSFNIEGTSITDLDVTRWNALPLYDFTQREFGKFQSSIVFSANSAKNFYMLNPTGYSTINGNNTSNIPFVFLFIAAADPASVQRYGFKPQIGTTRWMFDPTGLAQQAGINMQDTILHLTGKLISQYHPLPLMASGQVTIPLAPNVLIGTRFRFYPFKDPRISWDFYIEGFEHYFEFGGDSRTTLTLTRGLPTAVYQDTSLLKAIHVGNATRKEGIYTEGLPPGTELSLTIIETPQQAADLNSHLANVYVTPQAGAS